MRWNDTTAPLVLIILILIAAWYVMPSDEGKAERARREHWQQVFGQEKPASEPTWP